jgi:hypothetical protein
MKKTEGRGKTIAKWIIGIVLVATLGVGLGYGLFITTKNNQSQTQAVIVEDKEEASNEEFAVEHPPEIASYEGSEAEQKVKKEIPKKDEEKLKEEIGEKGFVNRAYGYAFIPPEGWFEDPINSDISPSVYYTTYDPEEAGLSVDIPGVRFEAIIQLNYKNQTLDQWIEDGHAQASEVFNSEKIKVGTYDAYKEEYDYDGKTSTITFLKDGDVYIFSMYGNDEEYEKNKAVFDEIINTLIVL